MLNGNLYPWALLQASLSFSPANLEDLDGVQPPSTAHRRNLGPIGIFNPAHKLAPPEWAIELLRSSSYYSWQYPVSLHQRKPSTSRIGAIVKGLKFDFGIELGLEWQVGRRLAVLGSDLLQSIRIANPSQLNSSKRSERGNNNGYAMVTLHAHPRHF